jgi:hypothetical protein
LRELGRWQSEDFSGKRSKIKETEPAPKTFTNGELVITHLNKQVEGNLIRELTKYLYLNSYFLEL